jgi:HAD domain in Swiss Army Knife RNA repair proteins
MILFLDFDGVLHAVSRKVDELFDRVPLLEAWLRDWPQVEIVISSSWREVHGQEEMVEMLGPEVGGRVVGCTPVARCGEGGAVDPSQGDVPEREAEIRAWMAGSWQPQRPWAALDDMDWLFSPRCEQLVLCDGRRGLTREDLALLTRHARRAMKSVHRSHEMSKPTARKPSWAPRSVLDVEAQEADRPLMAMLHRAMAEAVEPMVRARLAVIGATEPGEEPVPEPAPNPQPSDALSEKLALEFAGCAWATLLSRLDRQRNPAGMVDVCDLLPGDLQSGSTALLEQVRSDARHFGLTAQEINAVIAETLESLLAADSADPAYLRWPLGLRVERRALEEHLGRVLR